MGCSRLFPASRSNPCELNCPSSVGRQCAIPHACAAGTELQLLQLYELTMQRMPYKL